MLSRKKSGKKAAALAIALMVGMSGMAAGTVEADAAVKKPKQVKNVRLVEKTKTTLTVKWKKQKVSGYRIYYKPASSEKWKSTWIGNNTLTLSKLKPGTKYNIKVSANSTKNGKTYKGKVSKVLTVKTLKRTNLKKYTDYLIKNGVPEAAVDDVFKRAGAGDILKVVVTEKYKMNGSQVVVGGVYYDIVVDGEYYGNERASFVLVGDTVYGKSGSRILEEGTLEINHQEVTFKTGGSVKVPNATGTEYREIHDVLVDGKKSAFSVDGVTEDGGRYYAGMGGYRYDSGVYKNVSNTTEYDGDYAVGTIPWGLSCKGGHRMCVRSDHPDIEMYWTCDGTEPQVGQEDLFGKCRYTRYTDGGAMTRESFDPASLYLETQLRGTTSYGEKQVIFPENPGYDDENMFWVKVYAKGELIYEEFKNPNCNGYEVPTQRSDWKDIIWERFAELEEYELATYGPDPYENR